MRPRPAPGRAGRVPPAAVGQSALRDQNLTVVAQYVFGSVEPPSRAAVADGTGLTRSTVSRLVDVLLDGGLLRELDPVVPARGRPATPLAPAPGTLVGLGLEISPSYLGARMLDLTGAVVAEEVQERDLEGVAPATALGDLSALGRHLLTTTRAQGMTLAGGRVAVPGLVDADGHVLRAPNLGWRDVAVEQHLDDLGAPLAARNEADLAAVAHAMAAPGRPAPDGTFFYVSANIGIGGATVVDGVPATGGHGWAGEIGHTLVDPGGPRCTCGAVGCLEQYAGRDAVLRAAGLPEVTTAGELAAAAERGGDAGEAVRRAGWALGIAIANVVNVLDIDDVVLGGQLIPLVDILRPAVEAQLAERVLAAPWLAVRLRPGRNGLPALTGGATDALSAVVAEPARWIAAA